jgi:pimeloyl-ACP methyl ester carboxylesterase
MLSYVDAESYRRPIKRMRNLQERLDADLQTWRVLNGDVLPFDEAAARRFVERCYARAGNFGAALNQDLAGRCFDDDRRVPLSAVTAPTLVVHGSSRRPMVKHSRHRLRARDWRWCPAWDTIRSFTRPHPADR